MAGQEPSLHVYLELHGRPGALTTCIADVRAGFTAQRAVVTTDSVL